MITPLFVCKSTFIVRIAKTTHQNHSTFYYKTLWLGSAVNDTIKEMMWLLCPETLTEEEFSIKRKSLQC